MSPKLTLLKSFSHPPPELFCREKDAARVGITIYLDEHNNAQLFIPGNERALTDVQSQLVQALERAAGWISRPHPGERAFRTTRAYTSTKE